MLNCHIICGDSRQIPLRYPKQVDLIMTSPPYADARKDHYESVSPDDYANWFATFHNAFWQTLKPAGSLVINISSKIVNGVRHRYVWSTIERLTALGWFCVDDYIWAKKNAMPGFWPSRLRHGWEYCFHLAKTKQPFIDQAAVRVPVQASTQRRMQRLREQDYTRYFSNSHSGFNRNLSHWINKKEVSPSNVLWLAAETKNRQHPAVFPVALPQFFIQLLSPVGGLVMDPFAGSGTTGEAALKLGRHALLIDSNPAYCSIAAQRLLHQK